MIDENDDTEWALWDFTDPVPRAPVPAPKAEETPVKRGRGRPRKVINDDPHAS